MRQYVFKRLGKLSLNADLPANATHYRAADGSRKPIYMGRPDEVVLYYMVGDHRDLHLARVGSVALARRLLLDKQRHFGGTLPGPNGKAVNSDTAATVLRDAIQANPELRTQIARLHGALAAN